MHGWMALLGSVALAGQLAGVSAIAGVGAAEAALVAALAFLVGAPLARGMRPAQARRLAMLGMCGLGMTLGGWADLGFRSARDAALQAGAGFDPFWCGSALSGSGAVSGFVDPLSWMSLGMLAFGIPIAALRPRPASQLVCAVAMLVGMSAGSGLARSLGAGIDPTRAVMLHYALMSLGMLAGMLVQQRVSRGALATA
jgi:hypothetical protein